MKLRYPLIGAALLTLLVSLDVGAHRHIPREAVQSFATAWTSNQVTAILEFFESEADLDYPFGSFVVGRDNIRQLLRTEFAAQMQGSALNLDPEPLREREFGSWALVDFEGTLRYGNSSVRLLLSVVLTRPSDAALWSFTSLRMIPRAGLEPA